MLYCILIISTHTLRGERDCSTIHGEPPFEISTHTLRGERDMRLAGAGTQIGLFQLTRSVGSVTLPDEFKSIRQAISTHTLRGERDFGLPKQYHGSYDFNSHAPWGA